MLTLFALFETSRKRIAIPSDFEFFRAPEGWTVSANGVVFEDFMRPELDGIAFCSAVLILVPRFFCKAPLVQ